MQALHGSLNIRARDCGMRLFLFESKQLDSIEWIQANDFEFTIFHLAWKFTVWTAPIYNNSYEMLHIGNRSIVAILIIFELYQISRKMETKPFSHAAFCAHNGTVRQWSMHSAAIVVWCGYFGERDRHFWFSSFCYAQRIDTTAFSIHFTCGFDTHHFCNIFWLGPLCIHTNRFWGK